MAGVELLMQVKICGLCRVEDARSAVSAGASYVGVILSPGSRRSQSVEAAARILGGGGGARRVGVFVDAPVETVEETASRLGLFVVQLHGEEPPEAVALLRQRRRVWKALRPRGVEDLLAQLERYAAVSDGILLDGYSASAAGGTGTAFSWEAVSAVRDRFPAGLQLIVAGGLTAANVERAIALLSPDVVDVSSGVEDAAGLKSEQRVREFIAAAQSANLNPRIPG